MMNNMAWIKSCIFVMLYCWNQNGVVCLRDSNISDDVEEMRSTLQAYKEQNIKLEHYTRKLEKQNTRMKLIWSGLQQMCNALSMTHCECQTNKKTKKTKIPPTLDDVRILSIMSEGVVNDTLVIGVNYTAPREFTVQWRIVTENDNGYMSRVIKTDKQTKMNRKLSVVSSKIRITAYQNVTYVKFSLESFQHEVSISFNLTSLGIEGEQSLSNEKGDFTLNLTDKYQVSPEQNFSITLLDDMDRRRFESIIWSSEVFFQGLNLTSTPPAMISKHLGLHVTGNKSGNVVTFDLPYSVAQYGGSIMFSVPQLNKQKGYIEKYREGSRVTLISSVNDQIVPSGKMGLLPLPDQTFTYIFSPGIIIECSGIGNPRPKVTIWKTTRGAKLKRMKSMTLLSDGFLETKAIYVNASTAKAEQKYICRAENATDMIEVMTEAVLSIPVTFDNDSTGVLKNTTEKIVIGCVASGRPKPQLQLRRGFKYGSNLEDEPSYKVSRSSPDALTSSITVTVRPVDKTLNTVVCVEVGEGYQIMTEREIYVFPRNNETQYDYNEYSYN